MGKLFRCCCTCEGCGKGTLASLPTAFGKMQWHFGGLGFDLPSHPYHPLNKDTGIPRLYDCDTGCSEHYQHLSPWSSGTFDWQPWYQHCCCRDVDGENNCSRTKTFVRPVMTSGTMRVSFHRGKAYQGCDEANAEVCGYLVIAKFTFNYAWNFLGWANYFANSCASLAAFPDVEDIPADEDLTDGSDVLIGGSYWRFDTTPPFPLSGGSGSVTRVIFVEELNEDAALLDKDEEVALVMSALKHQPECCDIWDCDVELDCSDPAEFDLSVDAYGDPMGDPTVWCGGGFAGGYTITEWQSWDMSWDLSGGIWGIWNVP